METRIVEEFISIQGEGPRSGEPSYFIRTAECTLHCPFCDTKHALSKNSGELLNKELIEKIKNSHLENVVITGGEPTIHLKNDEFVDFISELINFGKGITFETTTIMDIDFIKNSDIISVLCYFDSYFAEEAATDQIDYVVSPKLDLNCYPSSLGIKIDDIINYYDISQLEALHDIVGALSFKFIYEKESEETLLQMLANMPKWFRTNYTYIMPYTEINNLSTYNQSCKDTIDFCIKHDVRYSPRIHIDVWGDKKGV